MTQPRTEVTIPGPAGALEALFEMPAQDRDAAIGVVCHPHPLYGGAMTNKVVYTIGRAFLDLGMPIVRFNFRGVGASAGTFADGIGETDDVGAVIGWLQRRLPDRRLFLSGFSFGGAVAIRAAIEHRPHALVTVAPAIHRIAGTDAQLLPACPWLLVQGDRDELVDAQAICQWAQGLALPPRVTLLAGAEHFFHGRLQDLRATIFNWATELKLA